MKYLIPFLMLVWALPVQAQEKEGPFGLYMGMPFDELGVEEKTEDGDWQLKTVPKPHPFLSTYVAIATENAGLCGIIGYSEAMADERRASREFETIKKQISSRYGMAIETEDGVIWVDSLFDLMGLGLWGSSEEVRPAMPFEEGSVIAEKNIEYIVLATEEVSGDTESEWYIGAAFIFSNEQDCQLIEGIENPF